MKAESLQTARLQMLPWKADDIAELRLLVSDPEVMRYLNSGNPWPQERVREFLDRQMRQFAKLGFCYWKLVLKETNSFAGFCGMQPLAETGEPEIGWTLTPSCWGQGLATEAASETVRDAFERVGVDHVVALAHPENRASIRVMEKLGMSYEKEMLHRGQIHVFYAMRKEGWLSKGTH